MFEVRVEAEFEAGHRRDAGGAEAPLHHHQWQVAVRARSRDLDHIGIVVDFRVLRAALDEVLSILDQRVLEDLDAFAGGAPTVPAVARWIFERLGERLPHAGGGDGVTEPDRAHDFWLEAVEVEADAGTRFEYRPLLGDGSSGEQHS
jgi:6-pyruvoyltetrahydropterin/6-carboxytetrahydropterin synthase